MEAGRRPGFPSTPAPPTPMTPPMSEPLGYLMDASQLTTFPKEDVGQILISRHLVPLPRACQSCVRLEADLVERRYFSPYRVRNAANDAGIPPTQTNPQISIFVAILCTALIIFQYLLHQVLSRLHPSPNNNHVIPGINFFTCS